MQIPPGFQLNVTATGLPENSPPILEILEN